MKKLSLILALIVFVALPLIGLAQGGGGGYSGPQPPVWGDIDLMKAIQSITNWFFIFLMITAVIGLIISGFYFITAGGDEDKVKTARRLLLYSLIAVAVGVLAKAMVYFVYQILGGK